MDVSLLDHGGQRFLDGAPRLEERRKVGTGPKARDPQLDAARAGLPVPVAVPVALRQPLTALLAVLGAGLRADLQFHQPLGREADHLAQKIRIAALLHERAQVHHRFGHRDHPSVQVGVSKPDPTEKPDGHRQLHHLA